MQVSEQSGRGLKSVPNKCKFKWYYDNLLPLRYEKRKIVLTLSKYVQGNLVIQWFDEYSVVLKQKNNCLGNELAKDILLLAW